MPINNSDVTLIDRAACLFGGHLPFVRLESTWDNSGRMHEYARCPRCAKGQTTTRPITGTDHEAIRAWYREYEPEIDGVPLKAPY